MLASKPASTLNQIIPDLGIPIPSKRGPLLSASSSAVRAISSPVVKRSKSTQARSKSFWPRSNLAATFPGTTRRKPRSSTNLRRSAKRENEISCPPGKPGIGHMNVSGFDSRSSAAARVSRNASGRGMIDSVSKDDFTPMRNTAGAKSRQPETLSGFAGASAYPRLTFTRPRYWGVFLKTWRANVKSPRLA